MKPRVIPLGAFGVAVLLLTACAPQANSLPELRASTEENVAAGRRLIASYGCGSCHTIPGIPGADALVAPPLERFYERGFIAGTLPNTRDNLIRWIQSPQQIKPGNAMPNMGISPDEARDIAAYLYHQPTPVELLSR